MEFNIFSAIMIVMGLVFTGIGILAWKKKTPMWFWSGTTVKEREIADILAYNRANAIMWICFSLIFWTCAFLGLFKVEAAGYTMIALMLIAVPILPMVYQKIYKKYKRPGR